MALLWKQLINHERNQAPWNYQLTMLATNSALFGRYIIKKHSFKNKSAIVETVVASTVVLLRMIFMYVAYNLQIVMALGLH